MRYLKLGLVVTFPIWVTISLGLVPLLLLMNSLEEVLTALATSVVTSYVFIGAGYLVTLVKVR